jgi:hypothetical protein
MIIISFLILQLALVFDVTRIAAVSVFVAGIVAISAIPAYLLRGWITFGEDGVDVHFGRSAIRATWDQVTGVEPHSGYGLCLIMKGQTQTRTLRRGMAGVQADAGGASIPLRLFGDRRFAMVYEVRDHSPHTAWIEALRGKITPLGAWRPVIVYGLAVGLGVSSIIAMAIATTS